MKDYSWILKEAVTGKQYPESRNVQIWNKDGRTAILTYDGDKLRFDGQFIDVGDEFMSYLSVMDDIGDREYSEPYE